jgi:hypothetical protein
MCIINLAGLFDFHCSSGFIGLQPPVMIFAILAEPESQSTTTCLIFGF